jgi:hypothetical protein
MNAIVLNQIGSKVLLEGESIALRIGYLLCNLVTGAGSTYQHIYFEKIDQHRTQDQKIDLIAQYRKLEGQNNDDWSPAHIKDTFKIFRKMKHPGAAAIASNKKLEKIVKDLYQSYADEQKEKLMLTGLVQLGELFEKHKNLPMYWVLWDKQEWEEKSLHPLSKLLKLDIENRERDCDFFFLTWDFFIKAFDEENDIALSVADAAAKKGGYLHTCFDFPNVNLLTVTEMDKIKESVKDVHDSFCEKSDEWIKAVYRGDNAEVTASLFIEGLLPAAETFKKSLEQEPLLLHTKKLQHGEVTVSVMLGELPVKTIWNFYRQLGVVMDETWAILEQAIETEEFKEKRYPVMAMRLSEDAVPEELLTRRRPEETEIVPVKKSIEID